MAKKTSLSKKTGAKTIFAAFEVLREAGGEMRGRDVIDEVARRVSLNDYEKERYEKTGYVRWESILHFYSIDCVKAGYLQKEKGIWILTPEGEEAMKLGPEGLLDRAVLAYREWKANQPDTEKPVTKEKEDSYQSQEVLLAQFEERAIDGIQDFLSKKNGYEFQDIVVALLKAMGYHISFNAKRGKDGGVDIIAYTDPLGTKEPRIKVQVKHKPDSAISVDVVRQLIAVLNKKGDVGIFVTSGRFTSDAEKLSRESHVHVELIHFERFLELWQQYYPKLTDEEKNMLPLHPIYFLGLND